MTIEFETIDVDITEEQEQMLVSAFVHSRLSPASVSTYDIAVQQGSFQAALAHAVINEMAIQILTAHIEEQKAKEQVAGEQKPKKPRSKRTKNKEVSSE
jgi:2-polyprenyl-6-methoxyphenol hydroxylase-like FAD-dependent oxidoreductase